MDPKKALETTNLKLSHYCLWFELWKEMESIFILQTEYPKELLKRSKKDRMEAINNTDWNKFEAIHRRLLLEDRWNIVQIAGRKLDLNFHLARNQFCRKPCFRVHHLAKTWAQEGCKDKIWGNITQTFNFGVEFPKNDKADNACVFD